MAWFEHELRVRYVETDQMGVVYHANYLNWFEVGRTELMRSMGLTYRTFEEKGLLLPASEVHVHYHRPAHYDDVVIIRVSLQEAKVRFTFVYEVIRQSDQALLVTGSTTHAWVNESMKPISIRKAAPEFYDSVQRYVVSADEKGDSV